MILKTPLFKGVQERKVIILASYKLLREENNVYIFLRFAALTFLVPRNNIFHFNYKLKVT